MNPTPSRCVIGSITPVGGPWRREPRPLGMTVVETVVMIVVGVMIMGFMYLLMTQSMRNTMKGTDMLAAMKEAHNLFYAIRKDVLNAASITTCLVTSGLTPDAVDLGLTDTDLPDPLTSAYPTVLQVALTNATVTYELQGTTAKHIERQSVGIDPAGNVHTDVRRFAVPRMKRFRCYLLHKQHETGPGSTRFTTRHVFVQIVLQSEGQTKSQREICLTSLFTPSNIALTNWNAW